MAHPLLFVLLLVARVTAQFPEFEQAVIDLPAAEITFGNISDNRIVGQESTPNLFARQACPQNYGQCGQSDQVKQLESIMCTDTR